ncbi:MAG: hypothetical protein AAGI12_12300 [Pseudomonadota bacterium]
MSTFTNIRLGLRLDELHPAQLREEGYNLVVDTRGEHGCARPAREALVRRLSNWRIDYVQVPVNFENSDHREKAKLEAVLSDCNGTAVLLTQQVFAAQGYLTAEQQARNAVEGRNVTAAAEQSRPSALAELYTQPSHTVAG